MAQSKRYRRLGVAAGSVALAVAAAVWTWGGGAEREAGALLLPVTQAASGHTLLHVNCKHHAHGPAWHKNHGRILGAKPAEPDEDEQTGRPPRR